MLELFFQKWAEKKGSDTPPSFDNSIPEEIVSKKKEMSTWLIQYHKKRKKRNAIAKRVRRINRIRNAA